MKKDCPERKNKPKDPKGQNGDAVTVENEGYKSIGVCVAIDSNHKDKWILDSRCTFHMSNFIGYFTEYQKFNEGRLMMGNNTMCRVISLGNVKLRLHDESVLEVKQVRHVPDLKRNLISLGMLDQMGYIVQLE